jgi:hypothetical protein
VFAEIGGVWLADIDVNCGYNEWLLHILVSLKCVDTSFRVYYRAIDALLTSKSEDEFRVLHLLKCLTLLSKINQN